MKGRHDRTAIADFLNPVNGYRGQLELNGIKPKDHRKENLKMIKQKQEELKKKEEDRMSMKSEPFKMTKFKNVQSKVKETLSQADNMTNRPQTAASGISRKDQGKPANIAFGRSTAQQFYKQHTTEQSEYNPDNYKHHDDGDDLITLEDKENQHTDANHIDYHNENFDHDAKSEIDKHKNFGKVPAYIEKYREEQKLALEQKAMERAKALVPLGTRLMGEDERIRTLDELTQEKRQISDLIFSMPLSMKTEALKNKKRELEQKLTEIEKAITTFSRKVVYIKDDTQVASNSIMKSDQQSITSTPKTQYGKFHQVKHI
eukprot:403365138